MPIYLSISSGRSPQQAKPVVASSDTGIVAAALRAVIAGVGDTAELAGVDLDLHARPEADDARAE